ncbi:hypothetical protein [Streptomyces sp. NPDC059515]|uniref:hypothetical protein n=1 Tax=Streptomyces sp. NPDC059515 TaxID=3346854 RepID=UPI00369C70BE
MSTGQDAAVTAAYARVEEIVRETADRIACIRQEVLDEYGVEILNEPMAAPSVMDVPMDELARMSQQCRHLLAGVEMLSPHVRFGEARTVSSVVKAGVDLATAAIALDFLRRSEFFRAEGVACDG